MKKILIIILMVFAMGCAKKYVKAPEEPVKPETGVQQPAEKVETVEEKISPREAEDVESSARVQDALSRFKDALFDYDKYDIRPDAREALDAVASWLNSNKNVKVFIEGHCDDRGTNEYNLALGERRAKAARDYLITRSISHMRMSIITYGEEKPGCTEQNEVCWQKNRRAHFVVAK